MASQSWLESSLRRSASLGLEVLERASRRSVDWTTTCSSQCPTATHEEARITVSRTDSELHDAFATVSEFMTQTTDGCKRFYKSGCCTNPSDAERKHMSRFHMSARAERKPAARPTRTQAPAAARNEDFSIEVSPGTYAITASLPESQRQTRLVSIKPGESISLTFDL